MARRRQRKADLPKAPESEYEGPDDAVLVLRGAMTPKTREQYRRVLSGEGLAPGAAREDAWHRAVEYLFEGRPLTLDRVTWSARRDRSAATVPLPPELSVSAQSAVISDAARDSSIDIPVEPGAASLIRVRTVRAPR